MAWYYIVLIIIGAHIPPFIALVICIARDVDFDKTVKIFFPILYLLMKWREKKEDAAWEAEQEDTKRLDYENEYHPQFYFRINKSIPLPIDSKGSDRLVIYFEWEYSEPVNRYINDNYDRIASAFAQENLTFIYPPRFLADLKASVMYNHPDAKGIDIKNYSAKDFYKVIADNIVALKEHNPMLFIPDPENSTRYPFEQLGDFAFPNYGYDLNYINDNQLKYVFEKHLYKILHFHIIRYEAISGSGDDYADFVSIWKIADEIQTRINQLYAMGVSEYVISQIVSLPKPKLSRLLITEDFRIFLPDYNNLEITMPTLSKVLFFFYLRHPEGVLFKELRDHKSELSEIYRTISPREDMDKMEKSIESIVDSTKNSVNEKCSRVRAAFVSQFNDNLAEKYYITGYAGEPKKIDLDRSLIDDKSNLI